MIYTTLACDTHDRILTLRLNRPEQLNAFTVQMANELIDVFERASEDDAIGAIFVAGNGRAFCAGMDLNAPGMSSASTKLSALRSPTFTNASTIR